MILLCNGTSTTHTLIFINLFLSKKTKPNHLYIKSITQSQNSPFNPKIIHNTNPPRKRLSLMNKTKEKALRFEMIILLYYIIIKMAQRLSYNYENTYEREKTSKMNQIENYVSVLIDHNKNYADQLNLMRKENTDLRGQVEIIMGEMLKLKENYEDVLAQTKSQYSQQISNLINELKDILHKKEQMQGTYKSLLEELTYQGQFQRKSREIQFQEQQRNNQNKMKILNDRILEQNRELQNNFYVNSDSKMKMVKEIDNLLFQIGELKKENNDLKQAEVYLDGELQRLAFNYKQAGKEKEEMGVHLLKIEQQKNYSIIQLRQSSSLLREQLNQNIQNVKKLQVSLIAKEKELNSLNVRYENERRQKEEYLNVYHNLNRQLNEKDKNLSHLQHELNKCKEYSQKEIKKFSELNRLLEEDNIRFTQDKQELQRLFRSKEEESDNLFNRVQVIERQLSINSQQLAKIQQDNAQIHQENDHLKQQIEMTLLDQKRQVERCSLQNNHIQTLQKIIQKEKKRNMYLQSNTNDKEREILISKQISYDQDQMTKHYEKEINQVMRTKQEEKGHLLTMFEGEKDRLVRMYEKALRQKQINFKEKINYLEGQVMELTR